MPRSVSYARALGLLWGLLLLGCASHEETSEPEAKQSTPGRFREMRRPPTDDDLTEEQREKIAELESVGYLSGSREPVDAEMIARFERDRSLHGLNFFSSGHGPHAYLIDMEGRILHQWSASIDKIFPDADLADDNLNQHFWRRVELFPDGSILGIFEGIGIFKIDRDSNVLWGNLNGAHHDFDFLPNGRVLVLTRKAHIVERVHSTEPILEDFLTMLTSDGEQIGEISILECFERSRFVINHLHDGTLSGDILHSNGIEILTPGKEYSVPWMQPGYVLLSVRFISAVPVIDFVNQTIVNVIRGEFRRQHDPRSLADGSILLFDNHGMDGASRVLEIDPRDFSIAWEFRGTETDPFFSDTCGMAERLPNGNTMVTESDNGRALEVDRDGQIVWEFYNPFRAGDGGEFIATLFEMKRLPLDYCESWLDSSR